MGSNVMWCICPNCSARLDECVTLVADLRCIGCATIVILVDQECLFSGPDGHGPFHRAPIERLNTVASVPPAPLP